MMTSVFAVFSFLTVLCFAQGQEGPAEAILDKYTKEGGWVFLDNVHLMQGWIPNLERKLEIAAETAHPDFRCFFSAEPINGAPQVCALLCTVQSLSINSHSLAGQCSIFHSALYSLHVKEPAVACCSGCCFLARQQVLEWLAYLQNSQFKLCGTDTVAHTSSRPWSACFTQCAANLAESVAFVAI